MAHIWIPALMQDLTGGQQQVEAPGATVREVIEALETRYPGIKARLCDGDRIRPNLAVVINGEVSRLRLRHKLDDASEVHFLPALSGG